MVRIDAPKQIVLAALEGLMASHKRSLNKRGLNPLMAEIIQKDIAAIANAINTATETKT